MGSEGRRARALLGAWVLVLFALSSVSRLDGLAVAFLVIVVVLRRGALGHLRRAAIVVLPFTVALWLGTVVLDWLFSGGAADLAGLARLSARALTMTFGTFAVLSRVRLFAAVAPWPAATRLLAVTLAQIHALRLVARESWQGFQSRMPRKPRARDAIASAGPLTATLATLALRNARDVTDALRARGA